MNINHQQITNKLSDFLIESLAIQTGFQKRSPKKIQATDFVSGFFLSVLKGELNPRSIAKEIAWEKGQNISPQAVDKKLQFRHQEFSRALLIEALHQNLGSIAGSSRLPTELFSAFSQVYMYDSTCLKLPANLAAFYPGPFSHAGACSTVRLQLRLNLTQHDYSSIDVQSYRDNDQKYAQQIAKQLEPDILNIFDLGYATLDNLEAHQQAGAYFLCPYRYGTSVIDPKTAKPINLLKKLNSLKHRNIFEADWQVWLGKDKRVPVRLIAIKADPKVESYRRKMAQKDRHKSSNHSGTYFQLLGWIICITNVPKKIWKPRQVLRAYSFRWRMEMIFKCWKSKFKFADLFKQKTWLRPAAAFIYLHLLLLWLTLFFVKLYKFFLFHIHKRYKNYLSLFKFADFVKEHFTELITQTNLLIHLDYLNYYCTYQRRKDRFNQLELLYMNSLS